MEQDDLAFHPKASEEYIEALGWYTQCGEHLGQGFEQEIDRALRLFADSPERWPQYGPYHRRILVRRFPYVVVYFYKEPKFGLWPSRMDIVSLGIGEVEGSRFSNI